MRRTCGRWPWSRPCDLDASPQMRIRVRQPVHGVGELGWSPPPPVYGHQLWRRLEYHLRGRYWKVLPRVVPRLDFLQRIRTSVTLASDARCWANSLTTKSYPRIYLRGLERHTPNERSWGENKTDWRKPSDRHRVLPVIFVEDVMDDLEGILGKKRRRNEREGGYAAPLQIVECLERGPRALHDGRREGPRGRARRAAEIAVAWTLPKINCESGLFLQQEPRTWRSSRSAWIRSAWI